MDTRDFDYVLPPGRIAQAPVRPRDHSRLLILNRATGLTEHRHFFDIGEYLSEGDLLVTNNSKVFRARLKADNGREIFLLRPDGNVWHALLKPGKKFRTGDTVAVRGTEIMVLSKDADGVATVDFHMPPQEVIALADRIGEIPVPPYIDAVPEYDDAYQTVYASAPGSVAAPTAGFHFTPELINRLQTKGVRFAEITLHVGLGTFRPVKTETLEAHTMHEEWIDVPDTTLDMIRETKAQGHRVIAVGTTTVRALESTPLNPPLARGEAGGRLTNIFIMPGYRFKTVDGIITNFHLPKSTLLVLVSAFSSDAPRDGHAAVRGREQIMAAYDEAIRTGYRFYSFGDAMFIQ